MKTIIITGRDMRGIPISRLFRYRSAVEAVEEFRHSISGPPGSGDAGTLDFVFEIEGYVKVDTHLGGVP